MCRLLAELTNTDLRLMAETIKRLEHKSGLPGVDIRLTADIHAQIHLKIRALGLDPHDSTSVELYASLLNLAAVHDGFLKKKFGLASHTKMQDLSTDTAFIFEKLRFNRRSWVLRHTVIRKLMHNQPPKALVRILGYRTAESLIKREPADLLLFLALQTESATWQQQFNASLKKLTAVDFEERLIDVKTLNIERYQLVANRLATKYHKLVFSLPLGGTVFILPPVTAVRPGMLLLTLMMALKETTHLQYVHSHLKHYQMESGFGAKVVESLVTRRQSSVTVAGHAFDWNIVHRHYGSEKTTNHPAIFQPHLQAEDLAYKRAEEILYKVEPALHFWHGIEYVGLPTKTGPISFNLLDVLVNLANGLSLENRHFAHLGQAVWDELLLRYLKHPAVEHGLLLGLVAKDEATLQHVHDTEFL